MRSHCTWLPRPTGTPYPSTSATPPSESPAFAAALTAVTMASSAAASKQRTALPSTFSTSPGPGRGLSGAVLASPSATMWLTIDTPRCVSSSLARVPAATRAAVSRADARSSTSRASSKPYFSIPGRSAWPGRGWVNTFEGTPGSGDISSFHFGHSVLAISMATGDPNVRPWRMPPRRVISSASKRIRGPRP